MNLIVKVIESTEEWVGACEVRHLVFQEEQGVSADLDFDGEDNSAKQFIACIDSQVVGTARVRYLAEKNVAKIERAAVLSSFRGQKIGLKIMEYIMEFLRKEGIQIAKLNAQERVKPFYEKLGFKQTGLPFDEAGISHIAMSREL